MSVAMSFVSNKHFCRVLEGCYLNLCLCCLTLTVIVYFLMSRRDLGWPFNAVGQCGINHSLLSSVRSSKELLLWQKPKIINVVNFGQKPSFYFISWTSNFDMLHVICLYLSINIDIKCMCICASHLNHKFLVLVSYQTTCDGG